MGRSGLASGRSGWACFRGIENIHGQSLSNVFVSSDPDGRRRLAGRPQRAWGRAGGVYGADGWDTA